MFPHFLQLRFMGPVRRYEEKMVCLKWDCELDRKCSLNLEKSVLGEGEAGMRLIWERMDGVEFID